VSACTAAGTYGDFAIDATGQWTYTLRNGDPAVQALTSAQHPVESFTVSSVDGSTHTITVTVNGANEAPTAAVNAASGNEDAAITVTLAGNDADGAVASFTITALPANGTLLFNGNPVVVGDVVPAAANSAALSFVPAADWNGSTTIGFSATDNEGATSAAVSQSITVVALNDSAVIGGTTAGSVLEAGGVANAAIGTPSTGGTLTITDPDTGEAQFQAPASLNGSFGSFTFDPATGAWTYTLDNSRAATQALNTGDTVTDTLSVTSADGGSSQTITVTVGGANDAAVITGSAIGSVTEDGTAVASGALAATDVDNAAGFQAATASGTYGDFSIDATGNWSYTLRNGDANVQALGSAAQPVESFTVFSVDGSSHVVTITVNGANEAPTATVVAASGNEDTAVAVTLTAADTDGSIAGFTITTLPANGVLSFNGTALAVGDVVPATSNAASLSFTPNANWNGSTSFVFTATDNEGAVSTAASRTITLVAVNDDPTAQGDLASTPINTALNNIDVLNNDADVDGNPLTVSGASVAPGAGTVTVNPDSTLSFTPATNFSGTATVTYTVSDGRGGTSVGTLTVNVGSNTPPQGSDATVVLNEDGSRGFSAADFGFSDADAGQSLAAVRIDTLPAAGTLTLNGAPVNAGQVIAASGLAGLVFTPAANANGNNYASLQFSVQDSAGAFDATPRTLSFDVIPVADAATIGGDTAGAVAEAGGVANAVAGTPATGGTLTIADADASEDHFQAPASLNGTYGSFTLDTTTGAWTYTLDNSRAATQALNIGDAVTDTLNVASADGTALQTITVTVSGANDAAVITGTAVGTATEDGITVAAGSLAAADVDNAAGFQAANASGVFGDFAIDAAGQWTYTLRNGDANVQALTGADHPTETFTVASVDGTTRTVTVTINGADDAAVIGTPTVSAVTEDAAVSGGNLSAAGSISISDADQGQGTFNTTVTSAAGNLGALVLAANGSYTYTVANSAVQFLGAGQTKVDTFTIASADGTTKDITFTINGANDAAVIGTPTVSTVTEDVAISGGNLSASGSISITDADQGQAIFSTTVTSAAGNLGTLVLAANGAYTYTVANAATQFLGAGQTKVDTFTVTSADGTTKDITFTINGANDGAVIGTPMVSAVTEDVAVSGGNLTASGSISITDADQGQATFSTSVSSAAGNLGTLVLAANGSYTYTVSNAATQSLGAGQTKVDTFTVAAADGTTKDVTFTINGANDGAVIGTPTVSAVTEDVAVSGGNLIASGSISITDADQGQATFSTTVTSAAGNLGSLVLAANGSYTYTVSNAATQFLGAGQTKVDTFTVTSADGTTKDVTFTINGANDAAVIGTPTVSAVTEDAAVSGGNLSASGSIPITDADQSQATFSTTVNSAVGNLGSLVLAANGSYTYTVANAATQFLGAGQTKVDTFTVTSADGTTKDVTFTINGANDGAVIGTPSVSAVSEDVGVSGGTLTASGSISITDADQGQATFSTTVTSAAGNLGSLALAANGSYTYTVANSATQFLGAGQTKVDTFTVTAADGTTKDVTFTINGANDGAVIGTPTVSAVTEDVAVSGGNLTAAGSISITDADQGQATFSTTVASAAGNLGSLVLAANGSYTYTVANAATQFLGAGQTKVDTFTVTSADGTTKDITFTINGANDGAVIGTPTVASVTEDVAVSGGNLTASGSISVSDADQGQATFSTSVTSAAGNLGTLVLAANGSYTYTVANADTQFLGAGQTKIDTFTVTSADGNAKDVTFTINGANDGAVIGTPTIGSVTEDVAVSGGNLTASGSIPITDADQGQAIFSTTVTSAAGNLGSLVLAANGSYTYTVANAATQFLGAGQTKVDTFTVTAADGTTKDVSFTINGANDGAVIGTPSVSAVTEDVAVSGGNLTASGSMTITDADQGQATFSTTVTSAAGNLGTLVLAANGTYTYTVSNAATQFLGAGQTKVDTFTIAAADGTTKDVTFTINGANDGAVIGTPTVSAVTEDVAVSGGNLTASGSISITDADQGQATFSTTVTPAAGNLGSLVLAANGSYTYTVANAATQFLGAGQTKVDTFTVTSADGTTKDVTFTINGANDGAVIGTPTVSSVTEDVAVSGGNLTASGSISVTDADQGQATFSTTVTSAAGNLGTLVLATNGSYTYTVSNAATQFLGAGQTKVDTFTVTSADGTTKDLTFTINGANDGAVIGTPTVSAVTEDVAVSGGNLTATGSISITDADQGQATFSTTVTSGAGNLGSLVLAANGSYTYTVANAAAQFLGAGQTKADTFTITAVDGTTKDVTFTINGANDGAVIGTPTVSAVTEDVAVSGGNLIASGSISITDADQGQATFSTTVTSAAGNLGSLVLAANGSYTYTVSNAATQFLGAGQTKVDTFTVTSADGTTKDVTFTINGANDAAVIGTPTVSAVTEDVAISGGNLTAAGSISITDPDQGQATFSTTVNSAVGNLGSLVLAANGGYTYTVANAATQFLGAGQTKVDTFTVTSADGTTKDVTFTINGANDGAVIGTPSVSAVTEDVAVSGGNLTASGSISITDADQGQATFSTTVTSAAGNLGALVLAANGSYTYTVANAATQFLGAGQTKVDTFTVSSADGTTKDVTFTINGANDAAVIGTPTVSAVTEDVAISGGNLTASGSISITDPDQGQATFNTTVTSAVGNLGTLVLAANGGYTYTVANAATQFLGAGQTKVDTFTVTSADGTTKEVTFTIDGANDGAVIGTPSVSAVTEDVAVSGGNLTASGSISITDADQGQASFSTTVTSAAGNLGTLVLATNGSYTYTVSNAAAQFLGAGQTKVDTFTVTSADGTTKDVTFTINGTNDGAVIGTPSVSAVTEDVAVSGGNLSASGSISISDADQGQATFSTTVTSAAGNLGSLVLAANGSYTYTVGNAATQFLGAGQTKIDTFTVTSADGTTKDIAFTINGANDGAVIGTPTVASVTEDVAVSGGNLTAAGSISITDADQGQATFSTTVTSAAGNLGTLVLAANGSYTYTVANGATQFLGAGQTKIDTFTVTAADGTTKDVTFTINGANDGAVIGTPSVSAVTEDVAVSGGNLTATGSISISDVDQGQATFSTTVASAAGNLGSLVLAANGNYTYTVSNAATQFLGAGQTKVDTFTVTAADGTTKDITFTINGANDGAVIGTPTVSTVTEDVAVSGGNLTAAGSISITDADQGQATFNTTVTSAAGNLGSLVLAANGSYTYTVSNAATQFLGAGQTKVDTFTVAAADGTTKDVTFTIIGANDGAVIGTPSVSAVTEDVAVSSGNLTASGSISISDADQGQATFSTTVASAAGNLGSLVLASNGSYTYTVANAATQFLGAGQTKVDTFTVTSADGTTKDLTFTINGANDGAVIGTPTVSSVTEDVAVSGGNLAASGSISITDADQAQAAFSTTVASAAGNLGSLVLAANGNYTYTVSNAATQFLGAGQTKVDTFTVTAADGTTKDITFTINGANDGAVIGTPSVSVVTEDVAVSGGNLAAAGSISITDADQGQATFSTTVTSAAGNLGTLVLAANGSYTYTVANAATQFLGVGQTKVDTFTVTSADGTTKDVTFTINGANDGGVIGTPTVASVTEDVAVSGGNLTASGSISITDADQGQATFSTTVTAAAGNLGSLVLAANGSYTYTVGNAATQFLGAGQTKVDTFTVTSVDGTTKNVTFTINGANDGAVIGTPSVSAVTEDLAVSGGNLTASGSISIADADQGQATFSTTVTSAAGNLGTLVLATNGSYTYTVSNAATQFLGAGQTKVDTFTVTSADGTTKDITFTINGANDGAVIGTPTVASVTEDVAVSGGNLTAAGSISITDADQGQANFSTTVTSAAGNLGTLVLAANGSYTYTVGNAATQFLGAGQTKIDTFTVTSADGTTRNVTFTINGANDAAVIGTPTVSTVTEDVAISGGNLSASGSISITDADQGQATFSTTVTSAAGNLGTLVLAANGTYTYTVANAATQSLGAGQSKVDTFTVTAADGTTKNITFTINGANDVPVANTDAVSVNEDNSLTIAPSVLLGNDTDADSGAALSITSVQGAVNGSVSLSGGNVVFVPAANYSGPASFTYTLSDGQGGTATGTVNVTVNPLADAPLLSVAPVIYSHSAGGASIGTTAGISQGNMEAALWL
jgi:large repetitive protein